MNQSSENKHGCLYLLVFLVGILIIVGSFFLICDRSPKNQPSSSRVTTPVKNKPLCHITSISPIKDSLNHWYGSNFSESIIGDKRILWCFCPTKGNYTGVISYDTSGTQIFHSEYTFTISPNILTKPANFNEYWSKGFNIAAYWLYYSTDGVLTFNSIKPFYNSVLSRAKSNYKNNKLTPFYASTTKINNFTLFLSIDLSGISSWRLSKE